ncbi:AimR family lysis-lysogeny pheromone receptor [Lentibacillus saliphilus]|uniref:AimR family lysis-lysogeny pheromone receptor n=1 Tax=Lentibacillus saliphilus TaxID=2737028 RepID=UPI001C30CEE3|nr:AimR family lysis-lysogeny pheromone receptor [Lentibacillus saliphilus]
MESSRPILDDPLTANEHLTLEMVMFLLTTQHSKGKANELLRQYCLQSPIADVQKKGMEFLYMNGYTDDLQKLIHKNKTSNDRSKQEWSEVYQFMLDRDQQHTYPLKTVMHRLNAIRTSEPELQCLLKFAHISISMDSGDYECVGHLLQQQHELVEKISDRMLMNFFKTRLYTSLFMYYWRRNELIIARKFAFRALNQSTNSRTKIALHVNLGLTYLFDTYEQGMYHMREALKLARTYKHYDLEAIINEQNIPFLAAEFGISDQIQTQDKSEQAHLAMANGHYDKAERILSSVPINTPFRLYYLGVVTQNRQLLLQSYSHFIEKNSDYFFSRLPLRAMQKIHD